MTNVISNVISISNPEILLQLGGGEDNYFPQINIYDSNDDLVQTISFVSIASGLYKTAFPTIESGTYNIQIKVYSDSGHSVLADDYEIQTIDVYYQNIISTDIPVPTGNFVIEIQKINDYNYNLSLLLEQYKNSENLKGLLQAMNNQANDFETAIFEIRDNFWLDTAIGIQLDIYGIILNFPRNGLNDSDYQTALGYRIAFYKSCSPEAIMGIILKLFSATYCNYFPSWPTIPAGYYIDTDSATITSKQLEVFSPSGVQPYLISFIVDANGNFIVDANGNKLFAVK